MSSMKPLILCTLGCIGIASLALSTAQPSNAQDAEQAKVMNQVAGAPKGGIVMLQDAYDVYIYDGGAKKIFVVSKTSSDDNGKPSTHMVDVSKIKD